MKLASWNVNSLRVRLPHVLDWLGSARPSVLGIQETKLTDDKFPSSELQAAGYHVVFAGQPTYNGVALLVEASICQAPSDIQMNNPLFPDDQIRLVTATLTPVAQGVAIRVICAYVPNGSEVGSDKYAYKLRARCPGGLGTRRSAATPCARCHGRLQYRARGSGCP